jgi:hypothetical protein
MSVTAQALIAVSFCGCAKGVKVMKALIVLSLVMIPIPVLAQVGEQGAPRAQEKERKICRIVSGRTSATRLPNRRLCLTRLEWRHRDDISTDDAQDAIDARSRAFTDLPAPPGS